MATEPSSLTTSIRFRMTQEMPDDIEVFDSASIESPFGSDAMGYVLRVDDDGNPVVYKGSLQADIRNPNLPEIAGNIITSSTYNIKLQWDAVIPTTSRLRVNGGGMYQVQKVGNQDKSDRYTLDVFCDQAK